MAKTGRQSFQFMLRLPDDLRERLKVLSDESGRSMTAEIVARLEGSLRSSGYQDEPKIRELEGRLAVVTGIAKARLQTIEAFIQLLAPSDEARQEIWKSIRSGNLIISDAIEGETDVGTQA